MAEQLRGFQDPKLEIRGANRKQRLPKREGDAAIYRKLMQSAADHKQMLSGLADDPNQDLYRQSADALRGIRHDVVTMGFNITAFDMIVNDEVTLREQKAAQEEEDARLANKVTEREKDWFIIRQEFPNQFDDAEKQAMMGDVPPRGIIYKNGDK